MTRKKPAPSKGDRHSGGKGTPIASGGFGRTNTVSAAPPKLRTGQARCPVCRNGVTLTKGGRLRTHVDLFDGPCLNTAAGDIAPLPEAPPVVLRAAHYDAPKGECRECHRWLPGERSICGRCSVLQGRAS